MCFCAKQIEDDGKVYTQWENMELPPVYLKTQPLVLQEPFWQQEGADDTNRTNLTYSALPPFERVLMKIIIKKKEAY